MQLQYFQKKRYNEYTNRIWLHKQEEYVLKH